LTQDLNAFLYIAQGAFVTLKYTFFSTLGGFFLGFLLALCKLSPFFLLKKAADSYTSIFRGTPLLLQLIIIYFGLPTICAYQVSALLAGVIAFSLNSGAYVSEIIKAGVQSVDGGQFEASQALGIPYGRMIKDVIFPQAIRNIFPALVNEVITLLKETALISILGENDLLKRARSISSESYTFFKPLLMAAFCYYVLVMVLSTLSKKIEKKLNYDSHSRVK